MANFAESVVEDAALAWLESLGYAVKHDPGIAPGEMFAERTDYGQVVLADRLRQALVRMPYCHFENRTPPDSKKRPIRKSSRVFIFA